MAIVAIMTLYNPDISVLGANIRVLTRLNISTIVYDNTPGECHGANMQWAITARNNNLLIGYFGDGVNYGLGKAYNTCIESCLGNNEVEAFLILDQDTDLEKSSLLSLINSYHLAKNITGLGVIGGKPIRADGAAYRYKAYSYDGVGKYVNALLVISSFSIIPKSAIEKTGLFQEDFFIDHIDYDFCWQCHKHGLKTLIDEESIFTHIVGKGDVRFLGKIICPISEPYRGYYQVRNTLLSSSRGGAPLLWTIKEIVKRFMVVSLNGLSDRNLLIRFNFALLGLMHGLKNIGGKLDDNLNR
ncbi:glycosyltransferase family protein [Quatrionicoccus australiensis]|uniref:hypothetical protein n=1 Tax=Quatrionicoccus australiensis TaxID=138118 RepID=UPI001CF87CC4|nr:hypothetical protein [Quatrionicoccus australiensis]UCV13945.1 hypothetical protein KI612_13395 [Quatrionicoccus australiensis]